MVLIRRLDLFLVIAGFSRSYGTVVFTTNILIDMLINFKASGQVFSLIAPSFPPQFSQVVRQLKGECDFTVIVLVNSGACLSNRERSVFSYATICSSKLVMLLLSGEDFLISLRKDCR